MLSKKEKNKKTETEKMDKKTEKKIEKIDKKKDKKKDKKNKNIKIKKVNKIKNTQVTDNIINFPKYQYKIQIIFYERIKAGKQFISNIKSISLLKNNDMNMNMNIGGLYSELIKYLFCPTTELSILDDPELLPKTMYIYMFDSSIQLLPKNNTESLIKLFCPYNLIPKDVLNYQIYDKRDIELLYELNNFYKEYGQIFRLQNLENGDKFDIILLFHVFLVDQMNFSVTINNDSECILDGKNRYTRDIYTYGMISKEMVSAFHTTYTLMYHLLEDIKKLNLTIFYKNIPNISIEETKACDITNIPAPYYMFTLNCNHSISFIALIGQMLNSGDEEEDDVNILPCPICRTNMKLKLQNSRYSSSTKNTIVNGISKECVDYLWLLMNNMSENKGMTKSDEFLTYPIDGNCIVSDNSKILNMLTNLITNNLDINRLEIHSNYNNDRHIGDNDSDSSTYICPNCHESHQL